MENYSKNQIKLSNPTSKSSVSALEGLEEHRESTPTSPSILRAKTICADSFDCSTENHRKRLEHPGETTVCLHTNYPQNRMKTTTKKSQTKVQIPTVSSSWGLWVREYTYSIWCSLKHQVKKYSYKSNTDNLIYESF